MLRYAAFAFNVGDDNEDDDDDDEEDDADADADAVANAVINRANNEQAEQVEIEDIYNTNNSLNIDDVDEDMHEDESVS
jgi:hypothetical protein